MKKIFRKEFIIGLVMAVALVLLFFGINFLKGINVFKAANYYYISYTNVEGLAVSAPVTVNGFKVGQVREITYEYDNPGHVLVEISLDKDLKVPHGTVALLTSDLLGTASIALEFAADPDSHEVGDHLEGRNSAGLMDAVSNNLMPAVSAIFPKIDTLLQNLNAITGDEALMASIKRLDAITANLATASARLTAVMATLPPITTDIKTITGNFTTVSDDLAATSARLRELPVDSLMANLTEISSNLATLSEALANPDSSLGLLTRDPALYNNINTTISNLDSLFVDIKKNPKRYISIKLL